MKSVSTSNPHWRLATFSLGFVLLLVCVAWVMREQSFAHDRRREREQ